MKKKPIKIGAGVTLAVAWLAIASMPEGLIHPYKAAKRAFRTAKPQSEDEIRALFRERYGDTYPTPGETRAFAQQLGLIPTS